MGLMKNHYMNIFKSMFKNLPSSEGFVYVGMVLNDSANVYANSVPKSHLIVHLCLLGLDRLVVDVVIVGHQLIDGALRGQFDDAVGHGVDKLMVV